MALSFDQFPLYDPIVTKEGKLSPSWLDFFATMSETLRSYISEYGVVPPKFTNDEQAKIKAPQAGSIIYNSSINKIQYYNGTTWVSIP